MTQVDINTLRTFPALQDVPDYQLNWLLSTSTHYMIEEGSMLATPDNLFTGVHFILSGSCHVYTIQSGNQREIGIVDAKEITGYLPYSRGRYSSVYMSAVGNVQVMTLPYDSVRDMIKKHFELTQALVHVMCNRIKYVTALQLQNEKMMALGKLSAGMTHELNNPASANIRDSSYLIKALQDFPEKISNLLKIELNVDQRNSAFEFLKNALMGENGFTISLKQRSDLEGSLLTWLEERNIENADTLSETLVDFGIEIELLEKLSKEIPDTNFSELLNWMPGTLEMVRSAENIQESSRRISQLVNSVKTYTHMDRGADRQFIDIHLGIRNTVVMLGHKIKAGNILVNMNFDEELPKIKALVGELNQVWTNIIDNALDAMRENSSGILTINTQKEKEYLKISIIDDGPGIPENIIPFIFDPFFTTKAVGQGTGIGLDLVRGIINQHQGNIKVYSRPLWTEFVVCIPINLR